MRSGTVFPGQELRERREAAGFSPLDIYREIHVPIKYVEALESGQFEGLPCRAYAQGFLKTYCGFLGLDPAPFVDQFEACLQESDSPARWAFSDAAPRRRPAWMADAVTWAAICAAILLGWVTYSTVIQPFTEQSEVSVEAGSEDAPPAPFFDTDFQGRS